MISLKKFLITTLLATTLLAQADEGMWVLHELNEANFERITQLGFNGDPQALKDYDSTHIAQAVVIFGGGCTGITVSENGLIFTNHHCGFGAIQQLSSVENNILLNGFVAHQHADELPAKNLTVKYLQSFTDVTALFDGAFGEVENLNEETRSHIVDSITHVLCDSLGSAESLEAKVIPFYDDNKYYAVVYEIFSDVRLVATPPTSVGKFGGDTDNWMWPRHTGDFSVFRVYADSANKPAAYNATNVPYKPQHFANISLQGYHDNDYAMTIGFPGHTDRYLTSWGVSQRVESINLPRITVREAKQNIWKAAMQQSTDTRIQYAAKYARSSNYWKNSIGMNRGIKRLDVLERKQTEEANFQKWVNEDSLRTVRYGNVLDDLERAYTENQDYQKYLTFLSEAFTGGTEIIRLAKIFVSADTKNPSTKSFDEYLTNSVQPFFKDYDPTIDQRVLAEMMTVVKNNLPARYLPDIYKQIDKKYKGDYQLYAKDVFAQSVITDYNNVVELLKGAQFSDHVKFKSDDPYSSLKKKKRKAYDKVMKTDPAITLYFSTLFAIYDMQYKLNDNDTTLQRNQRLYARALQEMYSGHNFYPDANFTMRLSYGNIGGYKPYDAAWYDYFTTHKGVIEKTDPGADEFNTNREFLQLIEEGDFAPYANSDGNLTTCFITNNDITGGNSGSPIFDKNKNLIGLAFDGNWEAMSGDIAFEHNLQRCIGVDVRYILFIIDKWGHAEQLINELHIVN